MFQRKSASSLAKKLQKHAREQQSSCQITQNTQDWQRINEIFNSFLAKLFDDKQLRILLQSLDNKGGIPTECVLLSERKQQEILRKLTCLNLQANVIFCKVLRWSDLPSSATLKALPDCKNYECSMSCLNPYHYSRIVHSESQLDLSQAELSAQRSKTEEACQASLPSTEEHLPSSTHHSEESWCSIAYWETNQRVGRIFNVYNDSTNVFYDLPQGDGLCIKLLSQASQTDYVSKIRRHIGFGYKLTYERGGIWIYNKSLYSLFVSLPAIQSDTKFDPEMNIIQPEILRIPTGHCVQVLDFNKPFDQEKLRLHRAKGSCDLYCVRVSFAKGWSQNYTRPFITLCPCWTEIYLNEKCLPVEAR